MASYKDDVSYNVKIHTVSDSDDLVTVYPVTKKENIMDLTNASTSTAGLMSSGDKSKLDGIASGAQVNTITGVKGSAESSYRTGNINITAANVGLGNVTNESKTTMFANAALTGTPTAPTPASSTNSTQIATTAFVQSLVGSKIAAADAMIYKGTIGSSGATTTTLPAIHTTGWTYKVITAGTYAGVTCEVGDMIICLADGTTANNADWSVVQTNIDGAVTGPSSAVGDRIAVFNGTTGKVIKDSGYTIATSVPANAKFTDTTYSAATTGAAGLMSSGDKSKLDGIASGAQVNQNAFSNVKVGDTTVAADSVTDTLTLIAGSNVTLTPDASGDSVTIAAADTKYTHPSYTAKSAGLYKVTVDASGHVSATTAVTKADITALGIPGSDTNTDTKVTQTVTTNNAAYPLLLAPSGQTATTTGTSYFDSGVTLNPSTNTIAANVSGSASSATKDSAGQQINTTYIKGISVSGKTITYTKGDGSTGTITTQDTTYSDATTSAAGLMSASDKTKLNNIASGAQVNQNAFSNVKVGDVVVAADSVTDTLNLVAGSNVTLTPDATNDKITIAATNTVYTHPSYSGDKTPGTASPSHGGEFDVVTGLTLANGHVSGYTTDTITLPSETTLTKSESGSGNAVTAITVSGHTVTVTKGKTFSESGHTHNYAGSSSAGGAATKAISDNNGKAITSYISALSVSGKTITYTKGDGTTGTITTQDTTYSDMTGATTSAAGVHGLVPTPAAGKQNSFLRGDGTWATPYTHPSYTAKSSGIYKITVDSTGHVSGTTAVTKDDIVNLGIPSVDTTYTLPQATASTLGGVKVGSNITVSSGTISLSKSNVTGALGYTPPTADTHYTTGLKVGASNTATGNAAASNGSVYLNALDNTTVRDSHLIKGTGATTVTSDANGVITINSTNTVYTHPSITASGTTSSPAAIANGGSFTTIDSVTVNSNGHVTGYNTKTVTLPTITAASLGLGNAMHFRGTTTDSITDGATTPTSVKLNGATTASSISSGDVVLYGGLEFIWTGSKWQKLGDETSFALKSNAISGLSVSGKTITYTKADGSTGTITTQDTVYTHPSYTAKAAGLYKVTVDATGHVSTATAVTKSDITALGIPSTNTDTNVTQTVTTSNANYPLLLAPSGQTTTTTGTSYFDSGVTLNPSTNTIAANITGNAGTATKATQDSAGQQINTTYIKALSISGKTITYTKGNGTTGTITTQDTTYNVATTSAAGLMSSSDKTKLDGIASGAQVNQNAFSNVKIGDITVAADSTTDTLTLVAGNNVSITPDATNDKITIAATDTVYTHPSYTTKSSGLYKVTVDATGHVSGTTAVTKADITVLGIPAQDTVYTLPNATSTVLGGVKVGSNITVSSGTISLSKSNVTSALGYTPTSSDDVKSLIRTEVTPTTVIYNTSDLTSNEAIVEVITQIQGYAGTHNIILYETEGTNSNHFYRLVDYDSESATFSFNNTSMNYVIYMDLYSDAPESSATRLLTSTKTAVVNALGYTPPQKLTFTNKTVTTSDWEEDETYPDFPYKASITCTGVTADYLAQVIFNVDEVISGIYAPVNETGAGVVNIWASELPEADIVIPTISCLL